MKLILPFVETMITYACNLSCTGCTNYSDYNMKGSVPWQKGKIWIEQWLTRLDILDFGIMGGEPTLNPECEHWIYGVRSLLPNSQIRFTTNGFKALNSDKGVNKDGDTYVYLAIAEMPFVNSKGVPGNAR